MVRILIRRVVQTLPIVIMVTFVVFALLQLGPGDPAVIAAGGEEASIEEIEAMRERLGLNDPIPVQYGRMLFRYTRGDLGSSIFSGESVFDAIYIRMPVTLSLAAGGLLFGLLFAFPLGIVAAANAGSRIDRAVIGFSTLGIASPPFFIGLLFVLFTRETFLPAMGYRPLAGGAGTWLLHLTLPSVTLGVAVAAELTRHIRGAMRDVLDRDYVRTARAKGVHTMSVLGRHALKNAALPILTVVGLQLQSLLAGAVVIESVFSLPGLGSLLIRTVNSRDYPMIQGLLLFIVMVVVLVNVIVDISYALLNPKVRAS